MRQVVVVTGSTSGIGRAVALGFAATGADVVVHGRDAARGESVTAEATALAAQHGGRAVFVAADLRGARECWRLIDTAVKEFQRIDVLVNNVAAVHNGAVEDIAEETLDELLAVNVRAPYLLVRAALPHLRESGGTIVNITGSPAYRGAANSSAFAATKAAMHSLTVSWARELGPDGIRVNEISPGATETPLSLRGLLKDSEQREALAQRIPARRIGVPEEIADAAVFLASDRAGYINGATLAVDGGLLA